MRDQRNWIACHWGKARAQHHGPAFHPLAYHMIDVAACMEALLDTWPRLLNRIATQAGMGATDAKRCLVFMAALHDLGKFADSFQAKAPEHWLMQKCWDAPKDPRPDGFDHGAFGEVVWRKIDGSKLLGFGHHSYPQARFDIWLQCAWSHHGDPIDEEKYSNNQWYLDISQAGLDVAMLCVKELCTLFGIDGAHITALPSTTRKGGQPLRESWLVAGLSVIADWLGSNQTWFKYHAPTLDLPTYWAQARKAATRAVREAGLLRAQPATRFSLASIAPDLAGQPLTPLQQAALDLPLQDGPTLAILEDLTGAGKTEAALLLAHRMMAAGKASGLYWALPTQATSNMLFDRLALAYDALFQGDAKPSLVLAHGGADLHAGFQPICIKPDDGYGYGYGNQKTDFSAGSQCAGWIADDSRKAFLAQVGVGTIDQALLGVLPTWFNSVRLAGLAGQVLIIDEVHSYDAYTTALVHGLLRFHAALGGSAILLSATLTREAKIKLMEAFQSALPRRLPSCVAHHETFPMISRIDYAGLAEVLSLKSISGTRRDLPVTRLATVAAVQERLLDTAMRGGCAVWIRNSVQDAIDAVAGLRAQAPNGIVIDLFHSRFTAQDRRNIEVNCVHHFGKLSRNEDRAGRIMVATQVVEQSLDIDFDSMVTDLAPLDLIIQRAGRLHRHVRPGREAPCLYVLAPDPTGDIREDWLSALLPRTSKVYSDHALLWSSLRVLQEALPLASANPRLLLEEAYAKRGCPPALEGSSCKVLGENSGKQSSANGLLLMSDSGFLNNRTAFADESCALTRWAENSLILRVARWRDEQLEPWVAEPLDDKARRWRLSELQVPRRLVSDIEPVSSMLAVAIEREKKSWPKALEKRTDIIVAPFLLHEAEWILPVRDAWQRRKIACYDSHGGLQFRPA